jgi:hypothetical protein
MDQGRGILIVDRETGRRVQLDIAVESDDDLTALEGALLAARAGELSQIRRRGDRLAFGYGSDSARDTMSAEVDQAERRWRMLDRLIVALHGASSGDR